MSKRGEGPVEVVAPNCMAHKIWHTRSADMITMVNVFCFHLGVPFSGILVLVLAGRADLLPWGASTSESDVWGSHP